MFQIFDKDGNKTIDRTEAQKHWSTVRFGKISANEFFNTVDFNGDGEIAYEEFVEFWEIVKGSGHSEEEIKEEVSVGCMGRTRAVGRPRTITTPAILFGAARLR